MRALNYRFPLCVLATVLLLPACESKDEVEIEQDAKPVVGVLELPLSHRHQGAAPSNPVKVEIGPGEIRVDGKTAMTLDKGKVADADKQEYVLPKLKSALSASGSRGQLAISAHATTPYATLARVIYTAQQSNLREVAFKVRKPAAPTETGWLTMKDFDFVPLSDDTPFQEADMLPWETFTKVWAQSTQACKAAARADCGWTPNAVAEGGKLDLMLRSRGNGLAVRFRQHVPVLTCEEGDAACEAKKAELEAKKKAEEAKKKGPEMLDGIAAGGGEGEEMPEEPSTEALYTLRGGEETRNPSAISAIVKPVCASQKCSTLLQAEGISPTYRVVSFIGAAFPDGSPEPKVAFTLPPK